MPPSYYKNKSDKQFVKDIRTVMGITDEKTIRQFIYIFNNNEKTEIFKEFDYFKLYYDVSNKVLFTSVINKFIKQKIYGIVFINIDRYKNNYNEYLKILDICDEYDIDIDEINKSIDMNEILNM